MKYQTQPTSQKKHKDLTSTAHDNWANSADMDCCDGWKLWKTEYADLVFRWFCQVNNTLLYAESVV